MEEVDIQQMAEAVGTAGERRPDQLGITYCHATDGEKCNSFPF